MMASSFDRTMASVIKSLGQASFNISAISNPLHTWEVGVDHPSSHQETLLYKCNNTFNLWVLLSGFVDAHVIEVIQMAICWDMWIERVFWKKHPSVIVLPPIMPPLSSDPGLCHLYHLPHPTYGRVGDIPFWGSASPLAAFLCFPCKDRSLIPM